MDASQSTPRFSCLETNFPHFPVNPSNTPTPDMFCTVLWLYFKKMLSLFQCTTMTQLKHKKIKLIHYSEHLWYQNDQHPQQHFKSLKPKTHDEQRVSSLSLWESNYTASTPAVLRLSGDGNAVGIDLALQPCFKWEIANNMANLKWISALIRALSFHEAPIFELLTKYCKI